MKKFLLCLLFAGVPLFVRAAHDHVDVRLVPPGLSQLGFIVTAANTNQIATYFPRYESPSADLDGYPGGTFARELTFSAFDTTSNPPLGAFVQIEIVSVTGPAGGSFSFWEVNATEPTWPAPGASPSFSFNASQPLNNGNGHIHGRVFTMTQAGVYDVTFRAVDTTGHYAASAPLVVRFTAILPPQLAISKVSSSIKLTFTSRPNLVYDLQSSTTLNANSWSTVETLDGEGETLDFTEAIAGRPRVFYRLVEYQ